MTKRAIRAFTPSLSHSGSDPRDILHSPSLHQPLDKCGPYGAGLLAAYLFHRPERRRLFCSSQQSPNSSQPASFCHKQRPGSRHFHGIGLHSLLPKYRKKKKKKRCILSFSSKPAENTRQALTGARRKLGRRTPTAPTAIGKARYLGVHFHMLGSGRNREQEARACQTRAMKVAEIH